MQVTIQNNKHPAQELNGRYYQTFTAQSAQELIKIHHLGCVGNTEVTNIQIEKGRSPTGFIPATETTPPLSGLFRDFRNLKVDLSNEDSSLRASFQNSAKTQMVQYFNTNVRSEIQQSANQIRQTVTSLVDNAVMKNDIQITPTGIQLGVGKYVNGETISSMLVANPDSIKAITKLMEVSGNLLVNGSITADKMAANSITAALLKAASVESKHIVSEAVEAKHLKVDEALFDKLLSNEAFINKLTAKQAFINYLSTVKIEASQIKADDAFIKKLTSAKAFVDVLDSRQITAKQISSTLLQAYTGIIGGFHIGEIEGVSGRYITGEDSFSVGMSNKSYSSSGRAALWVNWGRNWNEFPEDGWVVTHDGHMYAKAGSDFKGKVDFSQASSANFYGKAYFGGITSFNAETTFNTQAKFPQGLAAGSIIRATNGIFTGDSDITGNGESLRGSGYSNSPVWWNQLKYSAFQAATGTASDKRFKKNIKDSDVNSLDILKNINPVSFDYIEGNRHVVLGFIAQNVQEFIPDAVVSKEKDDDKMLYLIYQNLVPYTIKAIQELNEKITILEGKLKNGK